MSEHREKLDEEMWERMVDDEFAPARSEFTPDFLAPQPFVRHRELDVRRGTYDELREMKIGEGLCPMPGCSGTLDMDFFCSGCGHVSLPKALKEKREEKAA